MLVYRFEHKQTKRGMFTSTFDEKHKYHKLNYEIVNRLLCTYDNDRSLLPDPLQEYIEMYIDNISDPEEYSHRFYYQQRFTDYVLKGLFACNDLKTLSKWCLNDSKLLDKMLKCGYFLYELDIDEDQYIYELKTQVVFKRNHIRSSKILHAKNVLKEFLK